MAELAPATAALFSNLLSLVVRPAISEAGAAATATFFSNLSSLASTSADSETGVAGKAAFFSRLSSLAAISANLEEEILVDALAELIQTCSVLVLDLVEPDRQLC